MSNLKRAKKRKKPHTRVFLLRIEDLRLPLFRAIFSLFAVVFKRRVFPEALSGNHALKRGKHGKLNGGGPLWALLCCHEMIL